MGERRIVTEEDLYDLKSVSDPQFSPDGKRCVFVQTEILKEEDEYASNLYMLDLETEREARQWTFGKFRNHSPRWSPDGTQLTFVSNRSGKNQIYVMNASGGEASEVTSCLNGANNPVWAPDGKSIAFRTALKPQEPLVNQETDDSREMPGPLVVDRMKYKSDSDGFWDGRFKQVAIADLSTGEAELLTSGETDWSPEGWSPDGNWIAVSGNPEESQDLSFNQDIQLIHTKTRETRNITSGRGFFKSASFSPDGKFLGFLGNEREYENATLVKLWICELETGLLTCVTQEMDVMAGDAAVGDLQQGAQVPGILWGADSQSFYFLISDNGSTVIYFGNLQGEIYPALLDQQHVYGMSLHPETQRIIAAISRPELPGELFILKVTTGKLEQLTHVNEEFTNKVRLSAPESIVVSGSDGMLLHGWIMKPANYKQGEEYPMILEIHGGPHTMYANTYFHEFQVLAAKGYAVLYINPRGSHGYGQEFVNLVRGDYGGGDYKDLMEAVDYVVGNLDFIDKNRLGVTGGSYGGFMTNWIIGHTERFKAAVTQRSISNWISFYGVSDIGYYFTEWQIKAGLREAEVLWKHSPLAYVDNMNTPLLILHSEKDYRCPIEQAEQLFITLKRAGKTARLIRFPESNHELSRSGKPSYRIARLSYITDWFKDCL